MLTKNSLADVVYMALKNWHNVEATIAEMDGLLLVSQEQGQGHPHRHQALNRVVLNGLAVLERQHELGGKILRRRFVDGDETILEVAHRLRLSEDQVKRRQREALNSLVEIIWNQEMVARQNWVQAQQAGLAPAGHDHLIGLDERHEELVGVLAAPAGPWLVAIVGIGGIGKTSLANMAAHTLIDRFAFHRVVWLRLNGRPFTGDELLLQLADHPGLAIPAGTAPQRLQTLRQSLKAIPHLVILDNLESESQINLLAESLPPLANPSKFLLTSRVRLPAGTTSHNITLQELSQTQSLSLIRNQAQAIGLKSLAEASETELTPIYQHVGGNPLAIKLVVGLAAILPLPQILADLVTTETKEIEQLYRHIYWQTWHSLSEEAQMVLELMPMIAGIGARPEQIAAITHFEPARLWPTITELVNRSLLEVQGTPWERRYAIHRLTESFLKTEIIHWPNSPD